MHPYNHNANILFKAVRDNWPEDRIAEIECLDRVDADTRAVDEEEEDLFPDVVPAFIGRIPPTKDDHRYGPLNCGNRAQLMIEQSIGQLAVDGVPGVLKGRAAKQAKQARVTKSRMVQARSAKVASVDVAIDSKRTKALEPTKRGAKKQGRVLTAQESDREAGEAFMRARKNVKKKQAYTKSRHT
jgi:hypothetical protein